jgi:hypothetical protein
VSGNRKVADFTFNIRCGKPENGHGRIFLMILLPIVSFTPA